MPKIPIINLLPNVKNMLVTAVLFCLVIESFKLIPPYLLKITIDILVLPNPDAVNVFVLLGGILVVSIITTFIEDHYSFFTAKNYFTVQTDILKKAHKKILSLDLEYHQKHPSGESARLLNEGSNRLAELTWFAHDQFLGALIQIVLTAIILVYVHVWAGLVFLLFMPIVLFLIHRTGKKVQPYRQEYHQKFKEASWSMNQSVINIRTVKDYVQERSEKSRYKRLLDEYFNLGIKRMKIENVDLRNRDLIINIGRFSVLIYATYLVLQGEMTAGSLYLFATLSEKVISSLFRLGRLYNYLGDSIESIQHFEDLFKSEAKVKDSGTAKDSPKLSGQISFQNVSFAYDPSIPVLKNINLEIPAKAIIALVGRSGAGKSTLVKLISRHYDINQGKVSVDGHDIQDLKIDSYRKNIAIVSQDIEVFDSSIYENIAYGLDVSENEIRAAARAAHAAEYIERLPQGYHTLVGERGLKLSGGQKQRLGIARALVRKPAILIFDEATSSLDTESEKQIQEALKEIYHKQTMVIIAHRLSTIESADIIVVFENGEIVETGTHNELIKKNGYFARMKRLQELGEIR